MSVHSFSRQVRYTLAIDSDEQLVAAQRLITDFLSVLHRSFVACGRNHGVFLAVLRDGVGFNAASYLAATISADKHGQDRLFAPWPGDERSNAGHKRLVEAMSVAVTEVCFHQDIVPVQNCVHAMELILRDLMEACAYANEEAEKASYLAYFVIGDEAAFHLTCLLLATERDAVLDDLDFFTERLERFNRLVRDWESESTKEPDGR